MTTTTHSAQCAAHRKPLFSLPMEVYKFGGASIATPARMKSLLPIIQEASSPLLLVVSALGKTTNALEEVAQAALKGSKALARGLAEGIEESHLHYAAELLELAAFLKAKAALAPFFTELAWAIDESDLQPFDYVYDQIVCLGELLSTTIFTHFLTQEGYAHEWVDIRDVIRTDDTYRDARVDMEYTAQRAAERLGRVLHTGRNVLAQGFIGATAENASTTLGREGSDYTAALLASLLHAESVSIWKDVEGLQNADPRLFKHTIKIDEISYHEVIEMAFYGAQVIHPKTIKPLENNGIPLLVKCFLNKDTKGTIIHETAMDISYPPLIIWKMDQVLIQVTTRDFSFITEDNLSKLYYIFHSLKIKINLIQNAAISFIVCIDRREDKLNQVIEMLEDDYQVRRNEGVSLLTIRHYTPEILFDLTKNKEILLQQKTRMTVQTVLLG
jgi:aspartate kinase